MKLVVTNLNHSCENAVCIPTNAVIIEGLAVMGAGIAKIYSDRFPDLKKQLADKIQENGHITQIIADYGIAIVSFPTKYDFRTKSNILLIEKSAKELVELANRYKWEKVALPMPGTGNGKLPFNLVYSTIKPILDDRFTVYSKKFINSKLVEKEYRDKAIKLWEFLSTEGILDKSVAYSELNLELGDYNFCPLCEYNLVLSSNRNCTNCPLYNKETDTNCCGEDGIYNKWSHSSNSKLAKHYATLILEEIKNG